jgi:hypothetical protein
VFSARCAADKQRRRLTWPPRAYGWLLLCTTRAMDVELLCVSTESMVHHRRRTGRSGLPRRHTGLVVPTDTPATPPLTTARRFAGETLNLRSWSHPSTWKISKQLIGCCELDRSDRSNGGFAGAAPPTVAPWPADPGPRQNGDSEQQTQKGKRGDNEGFTLITMQGFSTVAGGDVSTAAGEEECRTGERNGHHWARIW